MLDSDDRDAMAAYIEAADRYFRDLENPERLFAKPFVPLHTAGYNVARLGYLLHHLDHNHLHTVLDFGAGMCWLSAVLLQAGCRVVALDVSERALALGAQAIARANLPPDARAVRFLKYDGFRLPLEDRSIDRVACFDALHHVPNKRTVLAELFRVLRSGGRACFVEPGPGHADSAEARQEANDWGVLEDEVDARALCTIAEEVGFTSCYVVPLPSLSDNQLTPDTFQQLRESDRRRELDWTGNDALIVLTKLQGGMRDSRSPHRLAADIEVVECPEAVAQGEPFSVELRVTNIGDTLWLALNPAASVTPLDYAAAFLEDTPSSILNSTESVAVYRRYIDDHDLGGTVTIGAQLWPVGGGGPIDIDYARGFFEDDVPPGQTVRVVLQMRAPRTEGLFSLRFDAVDELLTWFSTAGSRVEHAYLTVRGPAVVADSRLPGRLSATIRIAERPSPDVLMASIENTGDAVWLANPVRAGGWVRLGVQSLDAAGAVLDRDWRRVDLPHDVLPGQSVTLCVDTSDVPSDVRAVRLDLVSELRCWFEDHQSLTLTLQL
ncbi:class I SAM-dependent methyltransferase [Luteitalea sp.]|uniref:class I SAM-dependent methyltransferase n=1 Tax=Luteitalea sp. TaxID=2004800 RepID=UPI0025C5A625|nr:class I SAM-dependent methyltransferase [Luteitalea sp.]